MPQVLGYHTSSHHHEFPQLIFHSSQNIFSSVDLLKNEFNLNKLLKINQPKKFAKKHDFELNSLFHIINKFSDINVCVIGDLIIDEYIVCEALGMSQEDPTVVFTPIDFKKFIGGAGIVASHASQLKCNVDFISVAGKDSTSKFAKEALESYGVNHHIVELNDRQTTIKQRYRTIDKTVFKLSKISQNLISEDVQYRLFEKIKPILQKSQILIFSDFNYGCLPQKLIDKIVEYALLNNVFISADSQSSSQYGDIIKYKKMNIIFPTENEARVSLKNFEDGLVVLADKLLESSKTNNLLLKLGNEGLLIYGNNGSGKFETDQIESLNISPKDLNGAGDSLLVTSSLSFYLEKNIWKSACLGSIASALQVSKLGNSPITSKGMLEIISDW